MRPSPAGSGFSQTAPEPALGGHEDGWRPVARCFARQIERGEEVGAGFTAYHRGRCVVDVWGGLADTAEQQPWEADTRIVVFSVTKGFGAMAMHLLADRGLLEWDAPVATYWPGFATGGKDEITVATLLQHRGGLPYLDAQFTLTDCVDPGRKEDVLRAMENQTPAWAPGRDQGYHAITWGLYVRELFERIAGEPLGPFLRRELFEPLRSDVWLGTPESEDDKMATLYPPPTGRRLGRMIASSVMQPDSPESRMAKSLLSRKSITRRALLNPKTGKDGVCEYNAKPVRRSELAWASATASARGIARSYLPFAAGGEHDGHRFLREETLHPAYERRGWSDRDRVLQKPVGWSHGFLKEERHLFSPTVQSFGHAGLGGALGWCDPVEQLSIGYAMNFLDWRIRSPRAVALCRALYECPALHP